jgi:uncharacterized protein
MTRHSRLIYRYSTLPLVLGLLMPANPSTGASAVDSHQISFQSAGYHLVGTLTSPTGRPPVAGVLIIPGSGPVDRDGLSRAAPAMPPVYRQWAQRLGEGGFTVLRYDKRFLTHPPVDFSSLDQEAQIVDLLSATAFLRTVRELASKPIFIIGHSEGGTLAPIVAKRAGAISGVIVVNTVQFAVDELLVAQLQANSAVPATAVAEVKNLFVTLTNKSFPKGGLLLGAGAGYWTQYVANSRDSPATLSRLPMPVLLVQSLSDETLPGETLARNLALLRSVVAANENAQLCELPAHDHLGMLPGEREPSLTFTKTLLQWLTNAGRAAQPGAAADRPQAAGR